MPKAYVGCVRISIEECSSIKDVEDVFKILKIVSGIVPCPGAFTSR